jgi:hypothetical protein
MPWGCFFVHPSVSVPSRGVWLFGARRLVMEAQPYVSPFTFFIGGDSQVTPCVMGRLFFLDSARCLVFRVRSLNARFYHDSNKRAGPGSMDIWWYLVSRERVVHSLIMNRWYQGLETLVKIPFAHICTFYGSSFLLFALCDCAGSRRSRPEPESSSQVEPQKHSANMLQNSQGTLHKETIFTAPRNATKRAL